MSVIVNRLPSHYLAQGWCRGAMARNRMGDQVDPTSAEAVEWCIQGAMLAAHWGRPDRDQLVRSFFRPGGRTVLDHWEWWNDHICEDQAQAVAFLAAIEEELGYTVASPGA